MMFNSVVFKKIYRPLFEIQILLQPCVLFLHFDFVFFMNKVGIIYVR